jgi:hypothetical protein
MTGFRQNDHTPLGHPFVESNQMLNLRSLANNAICWLACDGDGITDYAIIKRIGIILRLHQGGKTGCQQQANELQSFREPHFARLPQEHGF